MPTAQLSDDDLEEFAREHVTYVVVTLVHAVNEVLRHQASGDNKTPTHNVNVEAAVVFARALHDFLCAEGSKPDDVSAVHYLPGWVIPDVLSRDLRDTINKQGPHLSTARLDKQGFDLPGITGDILRAVVHFVGQLDPDRREWFAQAEQVGRTVLAQLPAASARPGFSPMNAPAPFPVTFTTSN